MQRFNPLAGKTQAVTTSAPKPRARRTAPATKPVALSNAPAADAAPAAAPAPWTPAGATAKAALRVPLATYVALTPGLTLADAEAHRLGFAHFCDRHNSWTDWRAAHLAYLHPKVAIDADTAERKLAAYPAADPAPVESALPANAIPFTPPPLTLDERVQKFLASLRR